MPETALSPEQEVDRRLDELKSNENRTEEENKEFTQLRTDRDKSDTKKRIDDLTYKTRSAEEKYAQTQSELEQIRKENADLRNKPAEPVVSRETVEAGGKKYFTDKALRSMIDSGQMTESEAVTHKDQRIEDAAADKAYQRIKGDYAKDEKQRKQSEEATAILKEYPHFDTRHPEHNPDDPLYREVSNLTADNPGMSYMRALNIAKRLHPKVGRIDTTRDVSLQSPSAPVASSASQDQHQMTEADNDSAERMYRDMTNPATKRTYTRNEAISKYQKAMTDRKVYLGRK